jgi:hypothetical protein
MTEECWICFEDDSTTRSVCSCKTKVHLDCLARWQVRRAGTQEERWCRLCQWRLPPWEETLIPRVMDLPSTVPMTLDIGNGETMTFEAHSGPDGRDALRAFLSDMNGGGQANITYTHTIQETGEQIVLSGWPAYNAMYKLAASTAYEDAHNLHAEPAHWWWRYISW